MLSIAAFHAFQLSPTAMDSVRSTIHTTPMSLVSPRLALIPQTTWEPKAADFILERFVADVESRPFMVALVGIPGSGKSTSAEIVARELSTKMPSVSPMIMPHDGYHFPMAELRLFPDSDDAVYRRGAPDTFDAPTLLRDLQRVKCGKEQMIAVPGFDHAKGDPEKDAHLFDRQLHNLVICEGLYLLHDSDGWDEIKKQFNVCIYIDSDVDACIERLKIRNAVIPGYTPEELMVRVDAVDRANAIIVQKSKQFAHLQVTSFLGEN
jgi:pantothenate kinase